MSLEKEGPAELRHWTVGKADLALGGAGAPGRTNKEAATGQPVTGWGSSMGREQQHLTLQCPERGRRHRGLKVSTGHSTGDGRWSNAGRGGHGLTHMEVHSKRLSVEVLRTKP